MKLLWLFLFELILAVCDEFVICVQKQLISVCRFCIRQLCWICWWVITIFCFVFDLWIGFSIYKFRSFSKSSSFTSFMIGCLDFFPAWLLWLGLSVLRWTGLWQWAPSNPDVRGKAFIFSSLSMMLAMGLSYADLTMLRCVPSIPTLLGVFFFFIMEKCWILSSAFSAFIETRIWFPSFILLMWCITLIDLCVLRRPFTPGMNSIWSQCTICVMCVAFCLLVFCWQFLPVHSSAILTWSFLSL